MVPWLDPGDKIAIVPPCRSTMTLAEVEANACRGNGALALFGGPSPERAKNLLNVLGGKSKTLVLEGNLPRITCRHRSHPHFRAARGIFDRIGQDVDKYLLNAKRVAIQRDIFHIVVDSNFRDLST